LAANVFLELLLEADSYRLKLELLAEDQIMGASNPGLHPGLSKFRPSGPVTNGKHSIIPTGKDADKHFSKCFGPELTAQPIQFNPVVNSSSGLPQFPDPAGIENLVWMLWRNFPRFLGVGKLRFLVGERKSYKLDLDKFYVSPQKLNYSRGLAL
jgi:hypothetical protein